ncbi:olfactory receptor 11 [Bombyx mori]|uniref:Odorant receptor n=1 Tax=Bombyx mori TaxID=7091 RepID=C4B7U4_BOMMO|nr:olfactory receptor 11 [Bombyx mori]BAH66310.1 olfactory receptor [Bombyx mori]
MDEHSHFETSLNKIKVLFKYSGMNLENTVTNTYEFLNHRWVYILNHAWTLAAVTFICIGISNGQNFIEMTCIAPCVAMTVLAVSKSFFHYINENAVKSLLENLIELERTDFERTKSVQRTEIVATEKQLLNMVINVLYVLNCSMILVFDMTPLIIIAIKYWTTNKFVRLLPYLDIFVFVPYKFEYWVMAYILQIWAECIVLLFIGAADCLFFTCCTYIRIHFRLLQYDFERLTSSRRESDGLRDDEDFRETYTNLVKRHQGLIESSSILEMIYSKSTLSNFVLSSLVICLSAFNVTVVNDVTIVMTYLIFLAMSLMQVYFLCFFDMLMSASEEVGNAVYNCSWYTEKASTGKDLLFTITRAQKPCELTAAHFAYVNLKAFMRVSFTSASITTLPTI